MQPNPLQTGLLVFEENLELIQQALEKNVIRMANSRFAPQNPLRPNREVVYDETGKFVMPHSRLGISLAASFKQIDTIFKPKTTKWLILVDRNSMMPDGLKLSQDNPDHWSVVVTKKLTIAEFEERIDKLIQTWRALGRFVRYD